MAKTQRRRAVPFQGSSFSKSASVTPKRKGGGTTVHDPGAHLTGATATTYATLKAHDTARGTACAPAYVDYIDAAELQYEDDMRVASLKSSEGWAPDLRKPNETISPRSLAETAADATRAKAHATALKWASDCMQGKVESPTVVQQAPKRAARLVAPSRAQHAQARRDYRHEQTLAEIAQRQQQQAAMDAAELLEEESLLDTEIIDGADVMQQQQQMMQQQAAMDAALAAEEGEKKKKLILYAVLGLGAAGVVFYLIRRKA